MPGIEVRWTTAGYLAKAVSSLPHMTKQKTAEP